MLFSGEVRNHSAGREVSFLEYEAYEAMADKMIDEIVEAAKNKFELHILLIPTKELVYSELLAKKGQLKACPEMKDLIQHVR